MVDLFKRCNEAPLHTPEFIRDEILNFCEKTAGARPPSIRFMGWNAAIFDVPFLVSKNILLPPGYKTVNGKDERIGDFHYHIYDMAGAADLLGNALKENSNKKIKELVENIEGCPKYELPKDAKEHDAVYDCLNQINWLNGFLRIIQKGGFDPSKL
jgi:hypothetical protein